MAMWAKAKAGGAPKAKAYMDQRKAFLGVLARSMGGERGVLTDRDIERIDAALAKFGPNPTSNDSKDEADLKWNTIFQIIDKAEERWLQSISNESRSEILKKGAEKSEGKKIGRFTVEVE